MLSTILDTAIGVITGFISLILSHAVFAPRLAISSDIRVRWDENRGHFTYSIRLEKSGFIDLIDVRCQGRLFVWDVEGKGSKTWDIYRIEMSFTDRIIFPKAPLRIHFKLQEFWKTAPEKFPILVARTKVAIPERGVRMEDFFMSHSNAYLSVQFIGCDRFTGVIKAFVSPRYRMRDLRFGDWEGMSVREGPSSAGFNDPGQSW